VTEPICAPRRLLDRVRDAIARRNYSLRTEEAYIGWIKRFIHYHGKRHPLEVGRAEVEAFLTYLARDKKVSASTQNQALCALLFLYREVLDRELGWMEGFQRAKTPAHSPAILSPEEVAALLMHLDGTPRLMVELLYGAGLRLMECARLRIRDLDFEQLQITVHAGKGNLDRVTILPACLEEPLRRQVARVAVCTAVIFRPGSVQPRCLVAAAPTPLATSAGSMCFPRLESCRIRTLALYIAAAAIRRACSARCGGLRAQRTLASR
jgi:integrase